MHDIYFVRQYLFKLFNEHLKVHIKQFTWCLHYYRFWRNNESMSKPKVRLKKFLKQKQVFKDVIQIDKWGHEVLAENYSRDPSRRFLGAV